MPAGNLPSHSVWLIPRRALSIVRSLSRRRWVLLTCLLLLLACLICVGYTPSREQLLRAAGHALVTADALAPSDVIVISVDADGEGVLEAADLVTAGYASRVALFADPPDPVDREFLKRGVAYPNAASVSQQELRSLGIQNVEVIPRPVTGTGDEARMLAEWCRSRGFSSVVFIGTADHTRRTRRELARNMRASGVRVLVHPSRYSEFDPDRWWQSRNGIRTQVVESQKLLFDILRHPLQ